MAKLMDDHLSEEGMMGHGKVVGVEDSATAIFLGVHKYDDVFVGHSGKAVVQVLQVERRQIAVAIEGVEM